MGAALAGSGCVVPFVVPPLRSSASAGAAAGQLERPEPGAMASDRAGPITEIRGAIHPLQLTDRQGARRWDFGAGWLFQTATESTLDLERHGPFLEIGYRLWRRPMTDRSSLRLSMHAGAELLLAETDRGAVAGGGANMGFTLEAVTWASGPIEENSDDGVVVGGAAGESSVGLVASSGFRNVDGTSYFCMTLGVSLRSPGLAGIALIIPDRI